MPQPLLIPGFDYEALDIVEICAGADLANELGGTVFSKTVPALMTEPHPIVVPGPIKTWAAIQTSLSTTMGRT